MSILGVFAVALGWRYVQWQWALRNLEGENELIAAGIIRQDLIARYDSLAYILRDRKDPRRRMLVELLNAESMKADQQAHPVPRVPASYYDFVSAEDDESFQALAVSGLASAIPDQPMISERLVATGIMQRCSVGALKKVVLDDRLHPHARLRVLENSGLNIGFDRELYEMLRCSESLSIRQHAAGVLATKDLEQGSSKFVEAYREEEDERLRASMISSALWYYATNSPSHASRLEAMCLIVGTERSNIVILAAANVIAEFKLLGEVRGVLIARFLDLDESAQCTILEVCRPTIEELPPGSLLYLQNSPEACLQRLRYRYRHVPTT